jgi:hypothetical protein
MRGRRAPAEELAEEARQWDADEIDLSGWVDVPADLPVRNPSISVSLRFPQQMLAILKEFARRRGVPYQTMIKQWLRERLVLEARKFKAARRKT